MHHLRYSLSKHGFIDLRVLVTFVSAQSMIRGSVAQSMIYGVRHQNNLMTTRNSYSIELRCSDVFGCFWRGSIIISFQENAPVNISGRVSGGFRQNTQIHLATNLWEVSIKIFPSLRGGKVNKTCKLVITLPQLTWQVYIPLKNWPFAAAKERVVSLNHQFSGVNSLW